MSEIIALLTVAYLWLSVDRVSDPGVSVLSHERSLAVSFVTHPSV